MWIPRYSYQVWRLSGKSSNSESRSIAIKFIPRTITDRLENVNAIGDYYTPPGFWWDLDNDGTRDENEELLGIWVGKFEISHETLSSSATTNSLGTCTSSSCINYKEIRILPNVQSLRNNKIGNFFYASRHMEDTGNPFGLIAKNVDSHVIKNSEWGAVAYLARSIYGNTPSLNSASSYTTGCGTDATCNSGGYYQSTSYPQSTTSNVTGIFDTSGGAVDFVMGNWNNSDTYGGITLSSLDSKYYNLYPSSLFNGDSSSNIELCTLEYCGGHALSETWNWSTFGEIGYFVYNSVNVWFKRGGQAGNAGYQAGIGNFNYDNGGSHDYSGSRFALVTEYD